MFTSSLQCENLVTLPVVTVTTTDDNQLWMSYKGTLCP
jgi:hypothetical protein